MSVRANYGPAALASRSALVDDRVHDADEPNSRIPSQNARHVERSYVFDGRMGRAAANPRQSASRWTLSQATLIIGVVALDRQ
jgi:hypothetical protein